MQHINLFDVSLILIYLVCCLIIGLVKLGKIKTLNDYALGVRRFSTTVLIATTFATAISAHKTIGSVGKAYSLGFVFVVSMFLIPIGWFIMARLLSANLDFFHKKKFMTLGDIMEYHYGKYARWLSSICAIAFTIGIVAAGSMSIGSLLEYFFNIPKPIGMLLTLAIVTLYSTFGGIQSVAFTDVFQFLIFFVALPTACAIGYNEVGGYKSIIEKLPQSHLVIDKTNMSIFLSMAVFALMPNADIPFIQRALIARDKTQLQYTFNITAILMYPLFTVIALIGLMTYAHNQELTPDSVLFYFTKYHLPTGIVGLMIAGLLAVVMSTQDSFLNTTSTLIARDIFKQIWPNITEKQQLLIARVSCFTMSALAVSLIFIKQDILDLIWFITNFWDPLVIVPFIACLAGFKIKKKLFLLVPIAVLIAEAITSSVTGAFDTRSFTVGVITAAISLIFVKLLGSKKIYPKWLINYSLAGGLKNVIALIKNDTLEISVSYKFSILIIFGFFISIFFNPLTGIASQDSVFYLNAIAASLCILFLLSDIWLPHHEGKILQYLWYFILFFCLSFLYTYIMVRSLYYWSWIVNFILAIVLLSLITTRVIFFVTLVSGITVGLISGSMLNKFFPPNPMPPYIEFDTHFALYSCSFLLLIIALIIHNRVYVQKQLYQIIEKKVADRTNELQNALTVKREFLDNVSHEIKTPIHNSTNIITMLCDQWSVFSDEQKKDLALDLKKSNHRLLSLCSNLLDLSRFKKENKALNIARTNIIELVDECLHEYANMKSLITVKVANSLYKVIDCDPDEILQVIRNIISNAIRYGKNTPIEIYLANYDKNSIKITVSDEGTGIPEQELDSIFNPFEQSSATKTRAGGIGLGLAICRKILERHYGKIWATNNKYGGATFHIIIPRSR